MTVLSFCTKRYFSCLSKFSHAFINIKQTQNMNTKVQCLREFSRELLPLQLSSEVNSLDYNRSP